MDRRWSRLPVALVLGTGFAAAWAVAGGWLVMTIYAMGNPAVYERLHFKPDGTPVILEHSSTMHRYRDLEGHELDVSDEQQWLDGARLYSSIHRPASFVPVDWNQRIVSFHDHQKPPVFWYLLTGRPAPDRAAFIGFDSASGRKIGYIGTAGFSEREPSADQCFVFTNRNYGDLSSRAQSWLQQNYRGAVQPLDNYGSVSPVGESLGRQRWTVYVLDDAGKLWRVNLRRRQVDVAYERPVLSLGLMFLPSPPSGGEPLMALRTANSVASMNRMNEVFKPTSVPESLRSMNWTWAETVSQSPELSDHGRIETYDPAKARRDILVHYPLPHDPWDDTRQEGVVRIDLTGQVKSEQIVDLRSQAPVRAMRLGAGLCFPGPIPVATIVAGVMPMEIESARPNDYWTALGASLVYFAPSVLIAVAIGLAAALLVHRRELRYASPAFERWLWVLFALLTGIPGWIGYFYSRRWPVLEACPACGKPVPRDRLECAACQADFPMPAMTGTEILVESPVGAQ